MTDSAKLTRVGVFYDGNFFLHVSNYYCYQHDRRARISIEGLHNYIRQKVADAESTDVRHCQIVDAHYFRGRLPADEAQERDLLYRERVFDMVLIGEGVVTHYLPLAPTGEKGIDVWLALEALELAILKRFDVVVLIACDGDYVPLARKLNTLGARVMVLGWDFKFTDNQGYERQTVTAQNLINEVTYPTMMNSVIDDKSNKENNLVNGLFYRPTKNKAPVMPRAELFPKQSGERENGSVHSIKPGYGFVTPDTGGENLFFFYSEVLNVDFNDLKQGERVEFTRGTNEKDLQKRPCALDIEVMRDSKKALASTAV
jgi:cold shock CspA family protein/uncharacterized LabA/DUF88 family protein